MLCGAKLIILPRFWRTDSPCVCTNAGAGRSPVRFGCSFDSLAVGAVVEYLLPSYSCAVMLRAVAHGTNDG